MSDEPAFLWTFLATPDIHPFWRLRMNPIDVLHIFDSIPVLDHGHVRLIAFMGSDQDIEAAARVSYQRGTRSVSDTRALLRYMMRHRHTTPFEAAVLKIDLKMPIFVARQFVRHRTQSISEVSARYSELPEEFYVPPVEQVCYQDRKNRQGRAEPMPEDQARDARKAIAETSRQAFRLYKTLLEAGVARETARMVLPLNTYTQWNTTMNLHNLLHFLELRLDEHAQWEARQYAQAIARLVATLFPLTWEAFTDYRLEGVNLSAMEAGALGALHDAERLARPLVDPEDPTKPKFDVACDRFGLTEREATEFKEKWSEILWKGNR